MRDDRPKILVVCGPTATGKSAVGLGLAREFGGELVSADSMQVYKGLVIGTAALTPAQLGGIPQYLAGTVPPQRPFSVADWVAEAQQAIADTLVRGAVPVVVGGTGLYIESLVKGISFTKDKADPGLRKELYAAWEKQGGEALMARLAGYDPAAAARLHPNDQKRVIRALEQYLATGLKAEERLAASRPARGPYRALVLGLCHPERAALYQAIDRRVDTMMEVGLLGEAEMVWRNRGRYSTAAQAIGYKEFFGYFEGSAPLDVCIDKLKQATRNYAKRQLTWFRRMEGIEWLDAAGVDTEDRARRLVAAFLQPDGTA